SGNGRYVAFTGLANSDISGLINVNVTNGLDAELYDTTTGAYTLVSHAYNLATTTANDACRYAVIDDSGSTVLFLSAARHLMPTITNSQPSHDTTAGTTHDLINDSPSHPAGRDLYAYSLNTPTGYTPQAPNGVNATVTLRDSNLPTLTANGLSEMAPVHAMSDDGHFTVFISTAINVVAGQVDTNKTADVFLFDKTAGTNTLVSHVPGSLATTGNGLSSNAV